RAKRRANRARIWGFVRCERGERPANRDASAYTLRARACGGRVICQRGLLLRASVALARRSPRSHGIYCAAKLPAFEIATQPMERRGNRTSVAASRRSGDTARNWTQDAPTP